MKDRQAWIALKGILLLLQYYEHMDLTQIKDGICFLMLEDVSAAETKQTNHFFSKVISQKSNQERRYIIQDLLMTHCSLI